METKMASDNHHHFHQVLWRQRPCGWEVAEARAGDATPRAPGGRQHHHALLRWPWWERHRGRHQECFLFIWRAEKYYSGAQAGRRMKMHLKRNFNFLQSPGLRFRAVHTEKVCRKGGGGNVQQAANQRQQDHHQVTILALSPFSVME